MKLRAWSPLLLCAGCQMLGETEQPIFDDGADVVDDDFAHPAVFPFQENTLPGNDCTATLVTNDTFLTAAHCIQNTTTDFRARIDANVPPNLQFPVGQAIGATNDSGGHKSWPTASATVAIMPGFTIDANGSPRVAYDIALVKMHNKMPRELVAPLPVSNVAPNSWQGKSIAVIGSGNTDAACSTGWGLDVRRFTTAVDAIVPDNNKSALIMTDADIGASGSYLCTKDSGSPLLSIAGNGVTGDTIVGVFSAGGSGTAFAASVSNTEVFTWLMDNGLDEDDDNIQAALDNCEDVKNADQADSDDNGIGDACQDTDKDGILDKDDPCPNEKPIPNTGDVHGDRDGDGVCNATDNCAKVPNPNQRNCNDLVEAEFALTELGDACDPSPCPEPHLAANVDPGSYTDQYFCTDVPADFCPLPPGKVAWMRCAEIKSLELKVRALKPACPDGPGTCTLPPTQDIPTSSRFCQDPANNICAFDGAAQSEIYLQDSQCTTGCADPEAPGDPYLRITLDGDPETPKAIDYTTAYDNWTSFATFEWDYQTDYNRWTSTGLFPDPGSAYGLSGALWLHADVEVVNNQRRNGYYYDAEPQVTGCNACYFLDVGLDDWGGSGNFAASPPQPAFVWRPQPRRRHDFRRFDAALGEASLVAFDQGVLGAVSGDAQCGGEIANDRASRDLLAVLGKGYRWVNHAEPYDALGDGAAVAIAIDQRGNLLDAAAWDDQGRFVADADRGISRPAKRGLPVLADWQPVYSARRGVLYAVGGRDVLGRYSGQIWQTRERDAAWTLVPTSFRPSRVLAATYVQAKDELWVLDHYGTRVRLVAVNLRDFRFRTLGDWARHTDWDRQWLVAQPDGGVLLASTNSGRMYHAVSRFAPTGSIWAGPQAGQSLVRAPIADEAGVSRLIAGTGRSATVSRAPLVLRLGSVADLAGQL